MYSFVQHYKFNKRIYSKSPQISTQRKSILTFSYVFCSSIECLCIFSSYFILLSELYPSVLQLLVFWISLLFRLCAHRPGWMVGPAFLGQHRQAFLKTPHGPTAGNGRPEGETWAVFADGGAQAWAGGAMRNEMKLDGRRRDADHKKTRPQEIRSGTDRTLEDIVWRHFSRLTTDLRDVLLL